MVEKIANFLGDNGYTRAWSEGVDRNVITPVELQFVNEMPPVQQFNAFATRMLDGNAQLNERGTAFVDAVRYGKGDSPEMRQTVLDALNGLGQGDGSLEAREMAVLGGLRYAAQKAEGEAMKRGLDALAPRDGRNGYTELGRQMRQYGLGSPVAAYGLPAAGIGLAGWGIHDVLAAQQQAEKESQLPLQGGVR